MAPSLCVTQKYRPVSMLACFPTQAFPTEISSLRSPRAISPQSIADLALGLLSNLFAPAPCPYAFQGTCIPVQGTYSCSEDWLCDSHSIHTVTDQLLHSPVASNVSLLSQTVAQMWGSDLCFSSSSPQGQIQSYSLSSFSPYFLHPTKICVVLYFIFLWSGAPDCSQMVFCRIFCVWRYIPDASMDRDIHHTHTLRCHLVSPNDIFFKD